MLRKKKDYLQFSFDLQIKDLKNFTNLISQIKQKIILILKLFAINRKKMLSYEESLEILKETNALIDGHFILVFRIT